MATLNQRELSLKQKYPQCEKLNQGTFKSKIQPVRETCLTSEGVLEHFECRLFCFIWNPVEICSTTESCYAPETHNECKVMQSSALWYHKSSLLALSAIVNHSHHWLMVSVCCLATTYSITFSFHSVLHMWVMRLETVGASVPKQVMNLKAKTWVLLSRSPKDNICK